MFRKRSYSNRYPSHVLRINIFTVNLWKKEASDKRCSNYVIKSHISTQKDCQALCIAKKESECIGISYSHEKGMTQYCYLCRGDTLVSDQNEFGFYRRSGIFEICFFSLLLLVIHKVVNKYKEMGEVAKDLIRRMICNILRSVPEKYKKLFCVCSRRSNFALDYCQVTDAHKRQCVF